MMSLMEKYKIYIYERYNDLKNSKKDFDYYDLCKIFEYYTAIKLTEEHSKDFYEYMDISPDFKENNKMTRTDTGIDLCNLMDTIVQCKLRKNNLTWQEMSTFFASNITSDDNGLKIQWPKLIFARNQDCQLSKHLKSKNNLFNDKCYDMAAMLEYCEELIENPPQTIQKPEAIKLRDYQIECIELIKNSDNLVICLPTATGKNIIIINSLNIKSKYLILVPRIILMEQLKDEIMKHTKIKSNNIQLFGGNYNKKFDKNKCVTICVYNSIDLIYKHRRIFDKIFIDEAHHIHIPYIYREVEEVQEEDESYINKIKSLSKYNNNVYMSATIDNIDGFDFYKKDIREMIDQGYLCDYTIHVPIFSDDPSNKNVCEYLIQNYRNIIIYCESVKEGNEINKLLNKLQLNSSRYIDATTPKTTRNKILQDYKLGFTPFLVNVRVLIEGFDAPITRGVCLLHIVSSKTALIQIMGRALRLHPLKTFANIILPFSEEGDDKRINSFINVMAKNDSRIRTSFINKRLGGYINIDNQEMEDVEFRYELIYNNIGQLINSEKVWILKFENLKSYIDIHHQLPSRIGNFKSESHWVTNNNMFYHNKTGIMVNENIYNLWHNFRNNEPYNIYFSSNIQKWYKKLNIVKSQIDTYGKLPSTHSKDKKIKSSYQWINKQRKNFKKKRSLMENEIIYQAWYSFINDEKYKKFFKFDSYQERWMTSFKFATDYITKNNKLPSTTSNDKTIKSSGEWIAHQQRNTFKYNKELEMIWQNFVNQPKYKHLFLNKVENWKFILDELNHYIKKNQKFPPSNHVLNKWYYYTKRILIKQKGVVSENAECHQLWHDFINNKQIIHPKTNKRKVIDL